MLILTLIAPAVALSAPDIPAGEAAQQYNAANGFYRDGRFEEAVNAYNELIESGIVNPDLFYNASNASYRSGSLGLAILYLERAMKLAPSDSDILANLAYLNSIKTDSEPENNNAVTAFLSRRYNAININAAALWSGISFALAMLLLTAALYTYGWKRSGAYSAAAVLGIIALFALGILVHKIRYDALVVEAIVMTEKADAFSGPGEDNTHIFTIHEGTKIVIERSQDDWNLIRLSSGAGGWIHGDVIEKI